jgi:hypothetical protein
MASSRPASRVEVFDVLVPAGTAKAAPLETPTPFAQGEVVGVTIIIPDGHNGLTGIQLAVAHAQALPYTRGAWIVGNDDEVAFDTVGYPNNGAWSVFAYNVDAFPHTFHVRYEVADFAYLRGVEPQELAATPVVV